MSDLNPSADGAPFDPLTCAQCGADKKQFGTSVDLEIFYEDYTYEVEPSFCCWDHAAAWFNETSPDFAAWDADAHSPANRLIGAAISVVALGFLVLAVVGAVSLVNRL